MQFFQTSVILGLVLGQGVLALPTAATPKLAKRAITVNRVAAGWRERDALHEKVKAMKKFGIPMSSQLKEAHVKNRAAARIRAQHRIESANDSTGSRRHHGKGQGSEDADDPGSTGTDSNTPSEVTDGSSGTTTGQNKTDGTGQTGQVANIPKDGDVEFLSEITIGGQKIVMDFDTGSSDLWVFSTDLSAQAQQGHTVFDPTKSDTFKAADPRDQSRFNIQFGDGSTASGKTIGTDTVDIGGTVAQGQTVELADTVSGSFIADTASNGLVGLAFSSINTVKPRKAKTFFDTIADDLEEPILAANLKPNAPGSYSFGKIDNTAFTGDLTEVAIDNSNGFWQFDSSTFSVGNGRTQDNTENSPAIADTGTTLILVDDNVFQAYYNQVDGAQLDQSGQVTYPCSSELPDFTVAIGLNHNAVIPGKLINFQALNRAGTICTGAIQSNDGAGIQIYGDTFFKAQYTVFNIRKNTISVAPHS